MNTPMVWNSPLAWLSRFTARAWFDRSNVHAWLWRSQPMLHIVSHRTPPGVLANLASAAAAGEHEYASLPLWPDMSTLARAGVSVQDLTSKPYTHAELRKALPDYSIRLLARMGLTAHALTQPPYTTMFPIDDVVAMADAQVLFAGPGEGLGFTVEHAMEGDQWTLERLRRLRVTMADLLTKGKLLFHIQAWLRLRGEHTDAQVWRMMEASPAEQALVRTAEALTHPEGRVDDDDAELLRHHASSAPPVPMPWALYNVLYGTVEEQDLHDQAAVRPKLRRKLVRKVRASPVRTESKAAPSTPRSDKGVSVDESAATEDSTGSTTSRSSRSRGARRRTRRTKSSRSSSATRKKAHAKRRSVKRVARRAADAVDRREREATESITSAAGALPTSAPPATARRTDRVSILDGPTRSSRSTRTAT